MENKKYRPDSGGTIDKIDKAVLQNDKLKSVKQDWEGKAFDNDEKREIVIVKINKQTVFKDESTIKNCTKHNITTEY